MGEHAWSYLLPRAERCEHRRRPADCPECAVAAERARVKRLADRHLRHEFCRHDSTLAAFLADIQAGTPE